MNSITSRAAQAQAVKDKASSKRARLLKRLQQVEELPPADQRAVLKFVDAFVASRRRLQALADLTGISPSQIQRYENGASQPTLKAIRKLAKGLSVSADALVFEEHERGPDEDLELQFEAVSQFDSEEKKIAKALLDSLILKHHARHLARPA